MKAYRTHFRPEALPSGQGFLPFVDFYTRRKPTFPQIRCLIKKRIAGINTRMQEDDSERDYNSMAEHRIYLKQLLELLPERGAACQDNMPFAGQTRIHVREIEIE